MLPVILSGAKLNPSAQHLYSVLERDNDPLKRPQPIDNDAVFVEANPLYDRTPLYQVRKIQREENEREFVEANPLYGDIAFNVSWMMEFVPVAFCTTSVLVYEASVISRYDITGF